MFRTIWFLIKNTAISFIQDGALSRGAAVAFYAGTSLAPLLLITVATSGLIFGQDAARDGIIREFKDILGNQSAEMIQTIVKNAADKTQGGFAAAMGVITLLITTSGIFGEIQTGLNAIWKVKPTGTTLSRLVKARVTSLGLVAVLGFLLMASLTVSAILSGFSNHINAHLPFGTFFLGLVDNIISFLLLSVLFAAIYKLLPDVGMRWNDVRLGAMSTAILFILGKSLIGIYIGSSAITSSYGAASAPIIILLWIYYSSQIFFLGAEFTKVYSEHRKTGVFN